MSVNLQPNPGSNGPSAADIISYIGIPLAVLGVVPVFYTFLSSLATVYNIRRRLRRAGIEDAIIKSTMLSGVIEVDLPRCSLAAPVDVEESDWDVLDASEVFLLGGSWRALKTWRRRAIGRKSYRVAWSGDLREPQADVDFALLLEFLMARGAVPDAKGLHLLNAAGLWTPANTPLLLSPDRSETVLRVSFSDDSDGVLSLALAWKQPKPVDPSETLPPYWMRLAHGRKLHQQIDRKSIPEKDETRNKDLSNDSGNIAELTEVVTISADSLEEKRSPNDVKSPVHEAQQDQRSGFGERHTGSLLLQVRMESGNPVIVALKEDSKGPISSCKDVTPDTILSEAPYSILVAALAVALGIESGAAIWTASIPDWLLELSQKDVLPCGVLVMLSIVDEADAPSWETKYDPHEEIREANEQHQAEFHAFIDRNRRQQHMSPKERSAQIHADFQDDFRARMARDRERERRREQRDKLRRKEALESARLSTDAVLEAALKRVSRDDKLDSGGSMGKNGEADTILSWSDACSATESVLYEMFTDAPTCQGVCEVFRRWKEWSSRGGLNHIDLQYLETGEGWKWLCYAIFAMALLKAQAGREQKTVAQDLQSCMRTWKWVKLG